ncbi:MAG: glycosyltransferase family 4 protein [Flavobacteriales bacterium]|nr:glycosyltransferase family 4 protein [Flavobacteriales bacterium]
MKIIHIVLGKANPNRMNGVNKVVNSLISNQKTLGYDAELWGITHNLEMNFPKRNYTTRLFPATRNKFRISKELKSALLDLKSEVSVHLHGGFIIENYHIAKILNRLGIHYIYTPHGAYNKVALQKSKWLKKVYFKFIESFVAEKAGKIHFIGESEKLHAQNLLKNDKLSLIPNGQALSNVFRIKNKEEKTTFGFCGRIDIHTKGLDKVLTALQELKSKEKFQFWIIGDGGEMDKLKQLVVEMALEDIVVFKGALFGEDKMKVLGLLDAFVLASRNEGLPGAVLEAASLGVPAIVSQETNMGTYISNFRSGFVLKENTVTELVHKMQKMIMLKNSEGMKQLEANALHMVKMQFSWLDIAEKTVRMYRAA